MIAARPGDGPCCDDAAHAGFTTGERAAAHEDRDARRDLALGAGLLLAVASAAFVAVVAWVVLG